MMGNVAEIVVVLGLAAVTLAIGVVVGLRLVPRLVRAADRLEEPDDRDE